MIFHLISNKTIAEFFFSLYVYVCMYTLQKKKTHIKGILGILIHMFESKFFSYTFRYRLGMFIIEQLTVHTSKDN